MSNNTENNTNPLLDRLTPAQFNASVHFYEADQKLTAEDRRELASGLKSVMLQSTFVSYASAVGALVMPTIYAHVQNIRPVPVVGAGVKLVRPRVYKPFLSFMLGLGTLLIVNQQTAKYKFNQMGRTLEDVSTKSNQLNVWKTMDHHQSAMFYLYYYKTAQDPSFIIPDPRTVTNQKLHEVQYHPRNTQQQNASPQKSHWDDIRADNGFVPQTPPQPEQISDILDPESDQDSQRQQNGVPPPLNQSAWDAIRNNRGSNK